MNSRKIIIIVDDDADDREIVRDAFMTEAGEHDYLFLDSGDKLLEYLEQNLNSISPSLILLDLNMPGKDGRETLREIKTRKEFISIPTIVFTTSSSQRDKQICYDLGVNCFITKPDTFNKLVDITQSISRLWLM
jgi:CheY-like chemotaxis protein